MRRRSLHRSQPLSASVIVFLAGSFLPLWTVWWIGPLETTGEPTILWRAIGNLSLCLRETGNGAELWRLQENNVVFTTILVLISVAVGLVTHWVDQRIIHPIEAADYKDAPGGAVTDGRMGPTP